LLSFDSFIQIGTSRSTAKLKPLHGAIANDIRQRLGSEEKEEMIWQKSKN
jgi:hypothetical protein